MDVAIHPPLNTLNLQHMTRLLDLIDSGRIVISMYAFGTSAIADDRGSMVDLGSVPRTTRDDLLSVLHPQEGLNESHEASLIGRRVVILWPDDMLWYKCRIVGYREGVVKTKGEVNEESEEEEKEGGEHRVVSAFVEKAKHERNTKKEGEMSTPRKKQDHKK